MIERKKKLRIIQFFLLIFALLIIYLTYYNKEISNTDLVDSKQIKEMTEKIINFKMLTTILII